MEERNFVTIMNLFFYGIILIIQLLMPRTTRKNIYFGIRVPEEERENIKLKEIHKNYIRENILVSIPVIILLSYWAYKSSNLVLITTLPIFIYISILFLVYLHGNYKVKNLKEKEKWEKPKDEIVIDLKFSKEKIKAGNISALWFLIPVAIAIVNLVVGLSLSPNLPTKIPSHWDFQGNLDGYMNKTTFIWFMPLIQLGMAGVLFFVYKVIGWSKQEISSKNPKESVKRNIIYRRVWSIYILTIGIIINILFTLASFYSFGLIGGSVNTILILFWIFTILVIVGSIIISIKVGQGGSRLKLSNNEQYDEKSRDDDEFWKLGNTIYYNPEDPTLFIEKRFGVGWTVNAGKPLGMFFIILPFVIIIVILVMAIKG